jgi:selenocysteine lyase/cysteine desulfurase
MLPLDKIRADTRGCEDVVHLNNAGSSLPSSGVVDAMVDYLRAEEVGGGYETQGARAEDLDDVYAASAEYLGCSTDEVAFTASASDSWWRAFASVPLAPGDRILVGSSEFQTNAFGWLQARDRGVIVDVVPNTEAGDLDLAAFDEMFDERVKLVSLTLISMSNGAVHPAAEVGTRLAGTDAIYLLDACQGAGQMPLPVAELGCDFLNYTGRKFMRGPRGTGILYARADTIDRLGPPIFVDGRSATWDETNTWQPESSAARFEFGEQNYAGKVGLAVATRYLLELGVDAVHERVTGLAELLRGELEAIEQVTVQDQGSVRSGIVTFTVDGGDLNDLQSHLHARGINVSAPGQANAQFDLGGRGIPQVIRAGVHYFNTEAELGRLCDETAAWAVQRG